MKNVFEETSNDELFEIYKNVKTSEEQGLRPKMFDPYIEAVRNTLGKDNFSVAEGWKTVRMMFFEEVTDRFFRSEYGDAVISNRRGLKSLKV